MAKTQDDRLDELEAIVNAICKHYKIDKAALAKLYPTEKKEEQGRQTSAATAKKS